jgi:hypothetical protein
VYMTDILASLARMGWHLFIVLRYARFGYPAGRAVFKAVKNVSCTICGFFCIVGFCILYRWIPYRQVQRL